MSVRDFTLLQLRCFDAVVGEGSFQAAAAKLRRTHPTVFTAVKNLERQLGFALFDRDGYRVTLSAAGRAFHARAHLLLNDVSSLSEHAEHLAHGEESELSVVIGDLCPLRETLRLLRGFFDAFPGTRFHLHFEAISGPWERLLQDEADLIIHHIDKSDARIEFIDLSIIDVIPVLAPRLIAFPITDRLTPEQMRPYVQLIIRDTARQARARGYFLIEGARSWTVSDQLMKKELILQGMGWGHMPHFLVAAELKAGRLRSIAGKHFPGGSAELVAARRRDKPHGPIANRLWDYISREAPAFAIAGDERRSRRRGAPGRRKA